MLTVELRFKHNGREVSLGRFADELAVKLTRALNKQIGARKLEGVFRE